MKEHIKHFLEKYAPRLRHAVTSYNNRQLFAKRYGAFQNEIRKKLFPNNNPVVLSGPFAGMRYINEIVWGPITPKWLGTYESELHPVMDKIFAGAKYETVVDVGAAEGYYAVGLARHFSKSTVFTFDLDLRGRMQQRRLAAINKVNNLVVGSRCDAMELQKRFNTGSCLLICDIEGFEVQLLDPSAVPSLSRTDIVVEVHPAKGRSISEVRDLLIQRFQNSHEIEVIESRRREVTDGRHLVPLEIPDDVLLQMLDEGRPILQYWLWMRYLRPGPSC
ncbi:MAG TPA: hypothetical protein VNX46_18395 [Candidatus Acidoferrum sp.]|nr:hypothetical protein [Candidatus Acidoferrum sp.]